MSSNAENDSDTGDSNDTFEEDEDSHIFSDSFTGLSDSKAGDSSESEEESCDPQLWDISDLKHQWFSVEQFFSREYGQNELPRNGKRKRQSAPFSPYWFSRYAQDSRYFLQRMKNATTLKGHNGCVNCLNFNTSGNLLCSGSDDRHVNIWDWSRNKLIKSVVTGHTQNVFQCRWCLDDTHIITCARDGQVRIFDVHNPTESSKVLAHHRHSVHRCTMSSPYVIMTCGEDGAVNEIDLRDRVSQVLFVLKSSDKKPIPLYSINCNTMFTPNYFALGGRDTVVRIYDRRLIKKNTLNDSNSSNDSDSFSYEPTEGTQHGDPPAAMYLCPSHLKNKHYHSVTCAMYNSTGTEILISYNDEDLYVYNTKTGEEEGRYQGHRNSNTIKGCSWFGDDIVMSGSDDGHIFSWDKKSKRIIWFDLADEDGAVNCIEPHPSLPIFASSGLEHNAKIWTPTLNKWPPEMDGIKDIILKNKIQRKRDSNKFFSGGPVIWLLMRQIRERIRSSQRQEDESESTSPDEDETMDGSCIPS